VAYHLPVKLRASIKRRQQAEQRPVPVEGKPSDDQIAWSDLRLVLDEELSRLPEKYRPPLLLPGRLHPRCRWV
jgi:hypothetical protein